MSAAVILIPEMLSGPARTHDETPRQSDTALKTYTIDLSRSPATVAPVAERAPPPEAPAPATAAQTDGGAQQDRNPQAAERPQGFAEVTESRPSTEPSPQSAPVRSADTAKPKSSSPPAQPRTAREPAPAAPSTSVPKTPGWAVQAGSFANRATAERLAKDLAGSGHNAFVMPVKSGGSTLYRVRIGPFDDRAEANDVLANVKKRVANAAVVTHP